MSRLLIATLAFMLGATASEAQVLRGSVSDKGTGETLIGATVLANGKTGTTTDIDGNYEIRLSPGTHSIVVRYIGYKDFTENIKIEGNEIKVIDFVLEPTNNELNEIVVTTIIRNNTETAMVSRQKESNVVQSGVSSQQIEKSQDKDASEVIKRIPGISIIDDKFVMVRGLSQRYNNVWLNGGAVPSSEADSRAFSFDIIPSGQIDNMIIVKSPAPEYPADFSGGFILVNTKQTVTQRAFNISLGLGYNDVTTFRPFISAKGSGTDWLGFDNGLRTLDAGMTKPLNTYPDHSTEIDLLSNGLNNDWTLRKKHTLPNLKFSANYADSWRSNNGHVFGLLSSITYSNSYTRCLDMENSLYGPYDIANDKPVFLRKASDNQYSNDVRLGAMLNLSFRPHGGTNYFEWKNIFNQIGKDRYSERTGLNAQPDSINNMEYYYTSRTTYNTQLTGRHSVAAGDLDWSGGYAYANRNMPDRRLIERTDRTDNIMGIYRIDREFTHLYEHIASLNANYKKEFAWNVGTTIKTGVYGEYRSRDYKTRQFQYGWQPENKLPDGWIFNPGVTDQILTDQNYGPDKLYLYEEINYLNNYKGKQGQASAYASASFIFGNLSAYAGVRYEFVRQTLGMNTRQFEESMEYTDYDYSDLFPSINMTYRFNELHQLRVSYGRSVNRPEFRELSPSVFYDFDLGSSVMGNYDLKAAYIDNVDLRYEWYPDKGEQISLALFYKHFKNPIEWTYTVAGGTDLIYSYMNAQGANNYGIELDIRKSLDFIGLNDLSLSFNGALIKSNVIFPKGTNNIDRPMQGQSPYLINLGLFYSGSDNGWSASALYNRIGKRIIGVGNRYGSAADGTARNIPNSYEMPRNTIDISVSKKWRNWELKASVRDLLAEPYLFKQFEDVTINGTKKNVNEITKKYKPGRNFTLTINYNF